MALCLHYAEQKYKLFTAVKHRSEIKQLFHVSCHCHQSPAGSIVSLDFLISGHLMGDSGLTFPNVKGAGQYQS